jgi:hypothetical protein
MAILLLQIHLLFIESFQSSQNFRSCIVPVRTTYLLYTGNTVNEDMIIGSQCCLLKIIFSARYRSQY